MSVAYIWSQQLQRAADALPANKGRSSRVHALIRALGLVRESDTCGNDEGEGEGGNERTPGEEGAAGADGSGGEGSTNDTNGSKPQAEPSTIAQWTSATIVPPDLTLATEAELRKYHAPRYVDYLLKNGVVSDPTSDSDDSSDSDGDARNRKRRRIQASGLEFDCPPFPALGAYARLVAASTLTACRLLVSGEARTAIVWDGGRHHAQRAQASGFCYVADAVLGILYLCRAGVPCERPWGGATAEACGQEETTPTAGAEVNSDGTEPAAEDESKPTTPPTPPPPALPLRRPRILYLDMDLHYGDGVALAFKSPTHYGYPLAGRPRAPQVLTLSVHHCAPIFFPPGAPGLTGPDTPHPFSLAYPLAAYAHTATYARAWAAVERVAAAFAPDYVVVQLGVDGLPRDPVGMYGAWGVRGEGSVPWVVERVRQWDCPTVILGGGGYVNDNAARAWALATAAAVGKELNATDDVPDHDYWQEYAPAYTLEVPESHVPDENTAEALDQADAAFDVLADRIREIVALHK